MDDFFRDYLLLYLPAEIVEHIENYANINDWLQYFSVFCNYCGRKRDLVRAFNGLDCSHRCRENLICTDWPPCKRSKKE